MEYKYHCHCNISIHINRMNLPNSFVNFIRFRRNLCAIVTLKFPSGNHLRVIQALHKDVI